MGLLKVLCIEILCMMIDYVQCALNVFCPLFILHYIYRQKSFQKARKGVEYLILHHSLERRV